MPNISFSRGTLHLTQDCIGLHSFSLKHKVTDIMFVFDLINNSIVHPDFLTKISFWISYQNLRNSGLLSLLLFKTNSGTNSFLSKALIFVYITYLNVFFFHDFVYKQNNFFHLKKIVNSYEKIFYYKLWYIDVYFIGQMFNFLNVYF